MQTAVRRRIKDAEQRIAMIEHDIVPKPPAPMTFSGSFTAAEAGSARIRDLVVRGRLSLPRLDLESGEHLLVTGPNGSGKSTLLAVLAGRLRADAGDVRVAARCIGFLTQEIDLEDLEKSPLQLYGDPGHDAPTGTATRPEPRAPLRELGLLHPRDLTRPVGELSQGQQRRLALALVVAEEPDLVLLDEPTNHLSLALVDELESALVDTPATVVVASHDRWLRRRWQGSVHALPAPLRTA